MRRQNINDLLREVYAEKERLKKQWDIYIEILISIVLAGATAAVILYVSTL